MGCVSSARPAEGVREAPRSGARARARSARLPAHCACLLHKRSGPVRARMGRRAAPLTARAAAVLHQVALAALGANRPAAAARRHKAALRARRDERGAAALLRQAPRMRGRGRARRCGDRSESRRHAQEQGARFRCACQVRAAPQGCVPHGAALPYRYSTRDKRPSAPARAAARWLAALGVRGPGRPRHGAGGGDWQTRQPRGSKWLDCGSDSRWIALVAGELARSAARSDSQQTL